MKRPLIYGVVVAALSINLIIGARVYLSTAQAAEKDSVYPSLELFSYVMEKVRKDYVDGQNLKYQDLVYAALKGMLNTLDPHSEFMEPEKYKELQSDTQGAFGGLGIVISMKDNFITVISPMEDSPGFKAGIMSGDRIIKIDGKSTEKMSLQDAVKDLRGEPGTDVKISILRPSSNQVKDYKLSRAVINIDMVKDINGKKEFPLGDNKIGYIRLVQFGEKTSADLETALNKLKSEHMQGLVLDLRWNPGGLLDQAVDVCEKFLPRGDLVVTTEGRNRSQDSVRKAREAAMSCTTCRSWCSLTWAAPAPRRSSPAACRIPSAPSFSARRPLAKAPYRASCRCPTARLCASPRPSTTLRAIKSFTRSASPRTSSSR